MNGPQDLGGRHGFGPVDVASGDEMFHAAWEKRVLGITLAAGALGYWNLDASRHARESLSPAIYYNASYYEIWLRALERLLQDAGEVSGAELAAGQSSAPGLRADRCLKAEAVSAVLKRGGPTDRPGAASAFSVGDRVRLRNHQPAGHTRLPGYVRGCTGVITLLHGAHVYPDSHARFDGEQPQPLYTVSFKATEVFGADADPALTLSVDAWEPYLERA
ncbi:MAG: nitrile hydratase subunit beta [Pseudomonadota bacterium]